MKTTAEMKIEIANARISDAIIMPDGSCKLKLKFKESAIDDCILIEASKLSLKDVFMRYKPKTEREKVFKGILVDVIKSGIEDFYRPVMDPSFADNEKIKIHYMSGEEPAVGKSYKWWKETVKDSDFCFGNQAQYVAFLGVFIKMLVAEGWTVAEAWNAVCNDSKQLGHYWNSDDAKNEPENTGSREICGFFDLANTFKILADDEGTDGFWLAGGSYGISGDDYPLADLVLFGDHENSVPWLVLKKKH